MTRSEQIAMYETEVRSALGRRLEDHEVDLMRELWDEDVNPQDAALAIEHANETAWVNRQADTTPRGRYTQQEVEDIRGAGRGHLLRID